MRQPVYAVSDYTKDIDAVIHEHPTPADIDGFDVLVLQRLRSAKVGGVSVDLNYDLLEAAHKKNIPVIFDHDDNDYALPSHHGLYHMFKKDGITTKMDAILTAADYVTTTTSYLADVFGKRCSNRSKIHVFPNCVNPTDSQWQFPYVGSKRIRIGWAGGSSHSRDLKEIRGVFSDLHRSYGDRLQFQLGGYDTRGTFSWQDEKGKQQTRDIDPHETVWKDMAESFFDGVPLSARRTLKTLEIEKYGFFWSQFDIGIVPLEDIEFSRAKSALKLLEYGIYGIPAVVSDVLPYREFIADTGAATLVPSGNNNRVQDWTRALAPLIEDPVYRFEQGQKLKRLVMNRYDARKWAPIRFRFWMEVANKQPITPIDPERDIEDWGKGSE